MAEPEPTGEPLDEVEQKTIQAIAQQNATSYSSLFKTLAQDFPGLIDKLLNPRMMEKNEYQGLVPSLNFGNFSDDPTGLISDLQYTLVASYMRSYKNGWLTDNLVKKKAGEWMVDVETTKAMGAERINKMFFGTDIGLTIKKPPAKMFETK